MKIKPDDVMRRVRHEISAEHGHDSQRLLAHYQAMQEEMKKSGKYRFVTGFFATSKPVDQTGKN